MPHFFAQTSEIPADKVNDKTGHCFCKDDTSKKLHAQLSIQLVLQACVLVLFELFNFICTFLFKPKVKFLTTSSLTIWTVYNFKFVKAYNFSCKCRSQYGVFSSSTKYKCLPTKYLQICSSDKIN